MVAWKKKVELIAFYKKIRRYYRKVYRMLLEGTMRIKLSGAAARTGNLW